ncbi:MAG: hypothetical protein Ct9H300mP11_03230 [Chloroflexota bacterium]|nr:MAG: hypothetical protein Ct9H300mP11_03230 [Chloroflexota bacterium]
MTSLTLTSPVIWVSQVNIHSQGDHIPTCTLGDFGPGVKSLDSGRPKLPMSDIVPIGPRSERISTDFDHPTLTGYDSDHELAEGEVGRLGVAIDSVQDMNDLFLDIPR